MIDKCKDNIIKWGHIRPFLNHKQFKFNTLDIETVNNELFMIGVIDNGNYNYTLDNFYDFFHEFLISSCRKNRHILTWSRYDITFIYKLLTSRLSPEEREKVNEKVGKISPLFTYKYLTLEITVVNIIKNCMIFDITDQYNKKKSVTIYNLKNLFVTNLETTAENYKIDTYSKMGEEYHIIDKERFFNDLEYQKGVIKSNYLDNSVLLDISRIFLENFHDITGYYPKTIFTAGSIARSFLLSYKDEFGDAGQLSFKTIFKNLDEETFDKLLDYSMKSYHGGKVEVYKIGYIEDGYIIDKNSAYPSYIKILPKIEPDVIYYGSDVNKLDNYFYAFIKCNITIDDPNFIHPIIVKSPTNKINVSPYGFLKDVIITKWEYDYLRNYNIPIDVIDFIAVGHNNDIKPYEKLITTLIEGRYNTDNKSKADLYKTIVNSLYGITYELTPIYDINNDGKIELIGYRAGDYFNPIIASYITAMTRTDLSNIDNHILSNGGELLFNMTDSIMYRGNITLDIFSETKVLGKYSIPEKIKNIYLLGTGRYEYIDSNNEFVVKNRGFVARKTDKGFYSEINLTKKITIPIEEFVTIFKSTTSMFNYDMMGHRVTTDYDIQPFNLGGKRFPKNTEINLNKEHTDTVPFHYCKSYYR